MKTYTKTFANKEDATVEIDKIKESGGTVKKTIIDGEIVLKYAYPNGKSLDMVWLWKKDSMKFSPQSIIDKEKQPDFYLNTIYLKNGNLVIVKYGDNVSGYYTKKNYEVSVSTVSKKDIETFIKEKKSKNKALSLTNFLSSNLEKNIELAFSLLSWVEPNVVIGTDTKKEARVKAHQEFTKFISQ
jgi:hypothetical protein